MVQPRLPNQIGLGYPVTVNRQRPELPLKKGSDVIVFYASGAALVRVYGYTCFSKRVTFGEIYVDVVIFGGNDKAETGELAGFGDAGLLYVVNDRIGF